MITTARHRRYMFGAALLLSACNSSADNASTDLAMWTVNATPSLDISGNDSAGDPRIGIAEGVARLANGELVIADRGLTSLRFFSSNGELLRTVGREGEGPGEFRYIAGLLQCSDSLFVHDITRGDPYQVFAFDGSLARSLTFEYVQENTPYRTACNRDGLFLHMGWERHETMALGRARGTTLYWLADANGKHRASLGEFPGSERLVIKGGTGPHPLGREPVLAFSRERAYIGTADSFAVLSFATDGTPAAMLRYLDTDLRTTPDDIERFKFLDTAGQNTAMQQSLVRMWAGVEYPPMQRVSIFLNIFNVHVNRVPAAGKVSKVVYSAGTFFNASMDKASLHNERSAVLLTDPRGRQIAFVQIAGWVARRIVNSLREGQSVVAGERFGLIRFGSRAEIYMPQDAEILVQVGEHVIAGESLLAKLAPPKPQVETIVRANAAQVSSGAMR